MCSHSTLTGVAEMIKKCKKVAHTVVIPRHERAKDGGEEDGLEMEARVTRLQSIPRLLV